MGITREIENISQYFEGEPKRDWELKDIKNEDKYFVYYYRDKQGGWHHKTVKKESKYNPFETVLTEKDGIMWAKVINKKTGKPVKV